MTAPRRRRASWVSYLLLVLLAAIWSSSFMVIKVTVVTLPPLTLTAVRLLVAAVMLAVVLGMTSERLPRGGRVWAMCVLIGFFGNALPFTLIGWGETQIASSQAAILMAVMPLATVLLAHFFSDGERATRYGLTGIAIGFGGVVVLMGPSALHGTGSDIWHQLAVSGGAVSYAVSAVIARNLPPSSVLGRSVAVMMCATAMMLPAALLIDQPLGLTPASEAIWGAVYLGVLPTGIATLIYFRLIGAEGAGFFSYINYLIPVMGVFWGASLLAERVSLQAVLALVMILSGLFVANYRPKRDRHANA